MAEEDKTIIKSRQKKEETVAGLAEKIKKAKAMVFADFQGMTHRDIEGLKKNIKSKEAEWTIAKNTLIKRAIEAGGKKIEEKALEGPTAILFAYNDVASPLSELSKTIKSLKMPEVKFGILEDQLITAAQVLSIATLPSRDVLLSSVAGGLKAPIYGLHRALNWNLQKLVITLNAVHNTKSVQS